MKKCIYVICCLLMITGLFACTNKTGYTTLDGLYYKSETDHHFLIHETNDGDTQYILLNPAPSSNITFSDLKNGDKIKIKIVIIEEANGISLTNVFEYSKHGNLSNEISAEMITVIDNLSMQISK